MEKYPPSITPEVKKLAKELKKSFKLTDFEALMLALLETMRISLDEISSNTGMLE